MRTDHPRVFTYEVGGERGGAGGEDQTAPERAEATEQLLLSARSLGSKLLSKEAPPGRGSEHRIQGWGGGVCQEQYCRQWLRVPRGRSDQGWAGEQDEICNQQAGDLHMGTSPQTPSSQDGLEEESRKAESLPHASGLLHPHPCTGGTPQEEQVASATVNFHVHVRELWIPSEGPLSRASPEGSRRSRAEKQRDRPDGPKAPSQSVGPGSLQHRLPSGSSVVSSLSLTITEFCPSLHA